MRNEKKDWKLGLSTEWMSIMRRYLDWRKSLREECFRGEGNQVYKWELHENWTLGKKAKGWGKSASWEVKERLEKGGPRVNSRGGSEAEFILRRREGERGGETGGCLPLLSRYPARGRRHGEVWSLLGRPPQAGAEVSWSKPINVGMYVNNKNHHIPGI